MKFAAAALVTLLLTVTGCGGESEPTGGHARGRTQVTLQLNWKPEPQFGGFYAAQVHELYAKHGLDVAIREGGAGAPTVDMLAAGTVPFAIVSGDEIVVARSRGKKIVGLFAVYQTHPQGIMARASRGFQEIGDVFANPGTLGMEQGLGYSEFLKRKYGFDKLRVVPTPFGDLSFIRNDENYAMQVFVTSEPIAARQIGLDVTTFLIADAGYNPYATVLATSEDYLAKNRKMVEAMVAAAREGWQTYLNDPDYTNQRMRRLNPTMEEQTFRDAAAAQRALIETDATREHGLGSMNAARWQELIDQLLALGIVEQPPRAEECFELIPRPATPASPSTSTATTAGSADFTHVLRSSEVYYVTGPQQGRPPEGTLQTGTRVRLLESAGSYSRVAAEDGTIAWVASDALQPLP